MTDETLLTTPQAAELAGVSRQALYAAAKMGRIPYQFTEDTSVRASGGGPAMLFRRADVKAYIARATARKAMSGQGMTNAERQARRYAKKKKNAQEPS
jgi:hypothetical protein